jgi:hypothetical protein
MDFIKFVFNVGKNVHCRVAGWYIFKQKIQIWEGRAIEDFGIFYGHLNIFRQFGIVTYVMVIWYIFSPFSYVIQRKIWQLWSIDGFIFSLSCSRCFAQYFHDFLTFPE